jgi:hypothetical protein
VLAGGIGLIVSIAVTMLDVVSLLRDYDATVYPVWLIQVLGTLEQVNRD